MRSAHLAAGLLALALLAPTGAAEPLVDQIDDGGFEEWDGDDPAEWRILSGEANPTDEASEGDTALRLNTVGDAVVSAVGQNVSLEREDVPTVPNGTYALDFAAILDQGEDTLPTTPPDARAKVLWKNALGEVTDVDVVPITEPAEEYGTYNATLQAPIDATEAEVQFELERTSEIARTDAHLNVDDVSFGPTAPVPA